MIGGVVAAAVAAADAHGAKEHRFALVFHGSMVTTWKVPRAPFQESIYVGTGETCVRWWTEGEGRQEVSFTVRAPVRLTSSSPAPLPSGFRKIPWQADRRGTLVVETEPLSSCGGEFREVVGGADGDCGTREVLGYAGFGARAGGGLMDQDFRFLYKDCPILPGVVRHPGGSLDWYAEEPNHLVDERYNQGAMSAVRGKLPPAAAFRNCANKRLAGHYEGSETRNGIVDAQSGDQMPAGGPARWTSTTVVTIDVTYTRTGCGAR